MGIDTPTKLVSEMSGTLGPSQAKVILADPAVPDRIALYPILLTLKESIKGVYTVEALVTAPRIARRSATANTSGVPETSVPLAA